MAAHDCHFHSRCFFRVVGSFDISGCLPLPALCLLRAGQWYFCIHFAARLCGVRLSGCVCPRLHATLRSKFFFPLAVRCCSEPVGFLSFSRCRYPFIRPPFLPFMPTMFVYGLEWQGVRAWQFGALFLHFCRFIEAFHGLLFESGLWEELLRGGVAPLLSWRVFCALAAAVS